MKNKKLTVMAVSERDRRNGWKVDHKQQVTVQKIDSWD
ncbi:hypothetical protein CHCC20333_0101 [Bacillus paralicheniformis]|nr:hypothetical protein CHCC20333_0101 [Bacillus paralicheniformis]